jgi:site-specific DNA-methyltransferase (adenine-specific)
MTPSAVILVGNALERLRELPAQSVRACVTSPPYFRKRDYLVTPTAWGDGWLGCLGLEASPTLYVAHLVEVFREVRRVLTDDGTLWVNVADGYASSGGHTAQGKTSARQGRSNIAAQNALGTRAVPGYRQKDRFLVPERFGLAMQDDGWLVRQVIVWHKTNGEPQSVRDRPTDAWEAVYQLSKGPRYYYDTVASRRLGRAEGAPDANVRNVWTIPSEPLRDEHYAAFPSELPRRIIQLGSEPGDVVLDPFLGSGRTASAALSLGRSCIGIELGLSYVEMAVRQIGPMWARVLPSDVPYAAQTTEIAV